MSKDTKKEKNEKNAKKGFVKELKVELKKVTWPTGKELISNTATVIVITILLAVIVFVLDFAFEKANTYGVDKLKSIVTTSDNSEVVPEENNVEDEAESAEGDAATEENIDTEAAEGSTSEQQTTEDTQENVAQ